MHVLFIAGSNIGTTATGMLAALAAPSDKLSSALQLALVHLTFNISGILLFYPIPKFRWPISMAKKLGEITAKYRWFAVFYLMVMFFVIPALVFALSLIHVIVLGVFVGLVVLVILIVVIVNFLQNKCPKRLPTFLQCWEFLPTFLRSLEPYDKMLMKVVEYFKFPCCKKVRKKSNTDNTNEDDDEARTPIYKGSLFRKDSCELESVIIHGQAKSCPKPNEQNESKSAETTTLLKSKNNEELC